MYARMTIVCVFLLSGIQAIEVCSDQPADIGFLIDESGSVGATNFKINLDLITKIVDDFDIGNSSVKISTFAFHQLIGDGFYFSCCNDKASIKSNINSISFKGGGQDFEMALAFARKSMFQTNNGSRDFSLKILLFFTDGQSQIQDGGSLLHNLGGIVYAVGFGNDVDRNQLNKIATNESYVFMMPSYSDLIGQGYNDIKSQICIDVLTNQCDRNPQPCRNNGTCVGTGGSKYTCLCQIGYTDHNCQTDIDYCIGIICYNGGTCMDGLTSFVCQCEKYFTGILCETTDPLVKMIVPFARKYNVQSLLERIKEWLEVQARTRNDDARFVLMAFAMASEYGFIELYTKLAGNLIDFDLKSLEWYNEYKRLKDKDQIFVLNLRCERQKLRCDSLEYDNSHIKMHSKQYKKLQDVSPNNNF